MVGAFLVMRANKLTVMHIPFSQLHLSDESEVLGEGVHGKVLRGEYRGTQVAVKRMLAPQYSRSALLPCAAVHLQHVHEMITHDIVGCSATC